MRVFKEAAGVEFIFPTLEDQPLYEMYCDPGHSSAEGLIPTLPNVFMLRIPEEKTEALARQAETALHAELQNIGDACWGQMKALGAVDAWKARWDEQLAMFPIFNWQAVPVSNDWKADVENLGQQFAARRNTRDFAQWNGVAGATKDVLSGKEESIGSETFWENDLWKKAGPYGTMNCIKRLFPAAVLEKKFPTRTGFWEEMRVEDTRDISSKNKEPKNPYIAILAMDGDRMGAALKDLSSQEEHTAFSQTLAHYAEQQVKPLVEQSGGRLIYAGGDDVLAMCPAEQALNLADALCAAFREQMQDYELDASCGIAVGHYKFPLQRIVHEARAAETRAKNERGRAAFAMSLLKRSGETIHWGGKWDSGARGVYRDFTEKTANETFSNRFPYALAELLHPYRLHEETDIDLKPVIEKEFLHVQERQALKKGAVVDGALDYLKQLEDVQDFPNLFLASAFINRERGDD